MDDAYHIIGEPAETKRFVFVFAGNRVVSSVMVYLRRDVVNNYNKVKGV